MPVSVINVPLLQFLDDAGVPLPGAQLFSYLAGTSTPVALYADHLGITPLPNPAVADATGKLLAYGTEGQSYKLNLLDATGGQQTGWPVDYVTMASSAPTLTQLLPGGLAITGNTVPFIGTAGNPTLVASGALPANGIILFVQLTVTQQFGAGQGATGLNLGDLAILDRFGGPFALTVGVKPLRNSGLPVYPAATDLVLSTINGTYDGSGAATAIVYSIGLA